MGLYELTHPLAIRVDEGFAPLPSLEVGKAWLNIGIRQLEDYGTGVGRGNKANDQAAWEAFEAEVNAGAATALKLKAGRTYSLTRGLLFSHTPLITCEAGSARVVMRTGAGEFDWDGVNPALKYGRSHVGLHFLGVERPELSGVMFDMEPSLIRRCCIPTAYRGCPDAIASGLRFYGYNTPVGGMVCWQSSPGGLVENIHAEDCTTAFADPLFRPQLTVVEVDNDTPFPMYSVGSRFRNIRGVNVAVIGAALDMWRAESDVLTIMSSVSAQITVDDISGFGVGEVLDNWSSGLHGSNIYGEDVYIALVKLLYGASDCNIVGGGVKRTGLSPILINLPHTDSGFTTGMHRNRVTNMNCSGIGHHFGPYTPPNTVPFGAYFDAGDGVAGSHELTNCLIAGDFHGASNGAMQHVAAQVSGGARKAWGNRFVGNGSGHAGAFEWNWGDGEPMAVYRQ